ncbi:MAG: type VI secretion system protein TssR domain-containing protein [Flavobacteriales bacterium]
MKIKYSAFASCVVITYLISSCQVRLPSQKTPLPSNYGFIDKINVTNGYPLKSEPWVVISDRANNSVFIDKGEEKSPKEIKFLEPLLVVKHKSAKGLIKVAEYNPDALLKKLSSSSVKTYGWIPEDQVLLWTNAIKNNENGFSIKAVLVPNHSDVLAHGEKYLENDSIYIYTSPELTEKAKMKLPVGQMVYIYKKAENGKRYLIGKTPKIKIDSIKGNIYGWVNSNMIASWGDRTGLKVSSDYSYQGKEANLGVVKDSDRNYASPTTTFLVSDAENRTSMENLIGVFPTEVNNSNQARFFSNALDYSKNYVYNVLGEPLYYNRYKEITNKNKNLNIVFTLDVSNEISQNTAVAKSLFQELRLNLDKYGYYKKIKFGAVLYKNNTCGEDVVTSNLSSDFEAVAQFIDSHSKGKRCIGYGAQPMDEGLDAAGNMLTPVKDETNVVVVVGATASVDYRISRAISSLSRANAKIISYQTISGTSDYYNNFVLLSENVVTNTAKNITELQKEKIVNQNSILNRNNYTLREGEKGVYSLGYPQTSMTQGYVIYPKKGEVNSNGLLAKSLDSLILQATHQNKEIDSTLMVYFKSVIGSSKTYIKPDFKSSFSNAPTKIPVEIAGQLVTYNQPFITNGKYSEDFKTFYPVVQKGILISEQEYDKLREFYEEIYKKTEPYSGNFSQGRAIRSYLKVLKEYHSSIKEIKNYDLKNKSMAYSVAISTGFDNSGEELLSSSIKYWKRSRKVPKEVVKNYFRQYKKLAERLLENKNNPKIKIEQNGETFYWLNAYFMPLLTPKKTL